MHDSRIWAKIVHAKAGLVLSESATSLKHQEEVMKRRTIRGLCVLSGLLTLILVLSSAGWAKTVQSSDALEVVKAWLVGNPNPMQQPSEMVAHQALRVRPFLDKTGGTVAHIIDLRPEGFVIVPADDTVEPILAFSPTGHFKGSLDPKDTLSLMLLKDIPDRIRAAQRLTPELQRYGADVASRWSELHIAAKAITERGMPNHGFKVATLAPIVNPLISDKWGQPNPYNNYIPNHAPYTGCIATAMGMIIHWFNYPPSASGKNSITVFGTSREVSFKENYDYSQMPTSINSRSPKNQFDEIAKLLYDCGIAVGMHYFADGSGVEVSPVDLTPTAELTAYKTFFGYTSAKYEYGSSSDWAKKLEKELSAGYPAQLNILGHDSAGRTVGHSIICDGWGKYGNSTVFHLNLGWGGADNNWYAVPSFSAGGCTWTVLDGFVYDIRPPKNKR